MCYEVTCSNCGKKTWGGCGRHVPGVYNRIPQGQHCNCKPWPGVNPADGSSESQVSTSRCTIL